MDCQPTSLYLNVSNTYIWKIQWIISVDLLNRLREIWLDFYLKEMQPWHDHTWEWRGTPKELLFNEKGLLDRSYAHWKGQYIVWPLWGADQLMTSLFHCWICKESTRHWAGTRIQDQLLHSKFEKIKYRTKVKRLHLILRCCNDTAFQLFPEINILTLTQN